MKQLLVLLVFGWLFIGCESHTSPSGKSPLINLTTGGPWKYRIESKDPFSGKPMVSFDNVTIATAIAIDGELWDTVLHSNAFGAIPGFFPLLTNRDDGIWARFSRTDSAFHAFKYPSSVAENWTLDPSYGGADQWLNKATMVSVESVTISGVTYGCQVYQYIVSGGHHAQIRNIYIAPGFTIVKGVYVSDTNTGHDTVTYTLVM